MLRKAEAKAGWGKFRDTLDEDGAPVDPEDFEGDSEPIVQNGPDYRDRPTSPESMNFKA